MTSLRSLYLLAAMAAFIGCRSGSGTSRPIGPPYTADRLLGVPRPFEVGTISSDGDEYGAALTPDGRMMYLVRRLQRSRVEYIHSSQFSRGKWSQPRIVGFSGQWLDTEPFVSTDGRQIFFASNRPLTKGAGIRDVDIWRVSRKGRGWSDAVRVENVNSDSTDSYPSVTADGTLYFSSDRPGTRGAYDIYRSRLVNGQYTQPENLGAPINTEANDVDPYIAPDESYMIFSSIREGGYGQGDLYISFQRGGAWSTPDILPTTVNSSEYEYAPLVSPDSRYLFFSRGWGEILQIDLAAAGVNLVGR